MNLFSPPPDELTEQHNLIALSLVNGVGANRIRTLLAHFGSITEVMQASVRALQKVEGIGAVTAEAIANTKVEEAVTEQWKRAEKFDANLIPLWSSEFPRLLREIYDPPALLWMRGNLTEADEKAVAIVGTRRATDYGKRVAYQFAQDLARQGFTIVSGLAYGIDTAAHQGALDAGGRTIAILGSGVDVIYPAKNTALAHRIIESGALISEMPMGSQPDAPNFPKRNRIISGLSQGVLVAEAFAKGGALITAHIAIEQNREVFAIPSSIFMQTGAGCNELIKKGLAKLVTNVEDLLEEFGIFENSMQETASIPQETLNLGSMEQRLYDVLEKEAQHIDQICAKANVDPSTALVYLLSLEFKNAIRQMAGKMFYKI